MPNGLPPLRPEYRPLTQDEAECLGLDSPVCGGCHNHPEAEFALLRPTYAPPHPAGVEESFAQILARCAIDE